MNDVDDFLEHFGVKGMHWGVRKKPQRYSVEAKRKKQILDKNKEFGLDSLTNHEITQLTKRVSMEKSLKLALEPPKKDPKNNPINKGKKHVEELVALGTTVGAAYAFTKTDIGQSLINGLIRTGGKHARPTKAGEFQKAAMKVVEEQIAKAIKR